MSDTIKVTSTRQVVDFIYDEVYHQGLKVRSFTTRTGYANTALINGHTRGSMSLKSILDFLDALGYDLVITKR